MVATEFIMHKRLGLSHHKAQMQDFFNRYLEGAVADEQVAAWLMAVCCKGMSDQEATDLAQVMAHSGSIQQWSHLGRTADKHSSGGVGDKTSLLVAPILAACGLKVAKMSGRGLGHTGGTIDKLESIPGWTGNLELERFSQQVQRIGLALAAQTSELAPLDGKLYALRDVTATVDCLPLIAASIMSKKIASGAESIVLDVKVGSGAFMKTLPEAQALAKLMVRIGQGAGRRTTAVLSNMNVPLGRAVGNALEVQEAINILAGELSQVLDLALVLCEQALLSYQMNPQLAQQVVQSGAALNTFAQWIEAQGGDPRVAHHPEMLAVANNKVEVLANTSGIVQQIDALRIGQAAMALGGGRAVKTDTIDHSVGVMLKKTIGQAVEAGQPLCTLYVAPSDKGLEHATQLASAAYVLSETSVQPAPLVLDIVTESSVL